MRIIKYNFKKVNNFSWDNIAKKYLKMIKDLKIINIKDNRDDRGFFREIFKLPENKYFYNSQVSHSYVKKNIVKGFHGHLKQYQFNYIIKGSLNCS